MLDNGGRRLPREAHRARDPARAYRRAAAPQRLVPQRSAREVKPEPQHDRFTFGGKTIDFDTLELTVGDRVLQLTLMEANLLRYLVDHEGKAISRKTMLEQVWGLHEDTDTRAIDNFIVRLRRYIETEPGKPKHLLTVRGVGYRFTASPDK